MRSVAARPFLVIVAASHALRFLDARIRRIFGRRVERRFLDVWPCRSVAIRGGAVALRVSLADARARRARRRVQVSTRTTAPGPAPALLGVQDDEASVVWVAMVPGDFAVDGGSFCGAV